jgi:phosphate-selective porin O/P
MAVPRPLPILAVATGLLAGAGARADAPAVNLKPQLYGDIQVEISAGFDGNGDGVAPTTSVFLHEARVGVKGEVLPSLGYNFLVDLATVNNLVRDAYIWTKLVPHHELRIGQQKTLFGYENPEAATNLFVIDRSFVSDALARGPDLRDLGLGMLGTWELPAGFGVDYQLTAVDGAGANVVSDDTPRKNLWGRAGGSYQGGGWTVKLGVSGATGDRHFKADAVAMTPERTVVFTRLGVDVRADAPWAFALFEGVRGWDTPSTGGGVTSGAGFYALVAGKTPWNLGPIVRVEAFDRDFGAPGDLLRRYTVGAYADVKQVNARLLVNLEIDDSETRRDHALVSWVQVVF